MSGNAKYIGMDVHKEAIAIAVVNSAGKVMMEGYQLRFSFLPGNHYSGPNPLLKSAMAGLV